MSLVILLTGGAGDVSLTDMPAYDEAIKVTELIRQSNVRGDTIPIAEMRGDLHVIVFPQFIQQGPVEVEAHFQLSGWILIGWFIDRFSQMSGHVFWRWMLSVPHRLIIP